MVFTDFTACTRKMGNFPGHCLGLGGGNSNIFIFTAILGEVIQFDGCIFFKWVDSTTT